MSSCITTDGSDDVSKSIHAFNGWSFDESEILERFDVNRTAQWISTNGFKNIGLQFPDYLLHICAQICRELNSRTERFCFILGDSSYADCCVDELVGRRVNIDALVHYGRACLSPTSGNLPILYVFGNFPSSVLHTDQLTDIASKLIEHLSSKNISLTPLLITYDFCFKEIAASLCEKLLSIYNCDDGKRPLVIWSEPKVERMHESTSQCMFTDLARDKIDGPCGRYFIPLSPDGAMTNESFKPPWFLVHIGTNDIDASELTLYRILISTPEIDSSQVFIFDPICCKLDLLGTGLKRLIKRRSYLIEKTKESQCIGIVIGTLSVKKYEIILHRLKTLIKRSGRTCITLLVGRLNVAKLSNLPSIQAIVLIACPETSLLDSRDYFIPIVTPFEMECALRSPVGIEESKNTDHTGIRTWTGEKFWIDFQDLLPGGAAYIPKDTLLPELTGSFSNVSLTNNQLYVVEANGSTAENNQIHQSDNESGQSLIRRTDWTVASADHWIDKRSQFTWYGLDPQIGQHSVSQIKQGRHGLPTRYVDEGDVDERCQVNGLG